MDILSRLSKNPFVNVRWRVLDVLSDFDPAETVVPLKVLVNDEDIDIREVGT